MGESLEFQSPDRVTFGTVGPVGERVFVFQAREGARIITMKLEKGQVARLCGVLGHLLRDLPQPGELPGGALLDLESFAEPDLVVRALRVGYDDDRDRVVLVCAEVDDEDEDESGAESGGSEDIGSLSGLEELPLTARLSITREQALALAIRGTELVEAGRPACPRCGYPLDQRGHVCPRLNGHKPPLL